MENRHSLDDMICGHIYRSSSYYKLRLLYTIVTNMAWCMSGLEILHFDCGLLQRYFPCLPHWYCALLQQTTASNIMGKWIM